MTKTILETFFCFKKQYWKLYFCFKNNIGNFIYEDEEKFFLLSEFIVKKSLLYLPCSFP